MATLNSSAGGGSSSGSGDQTEPSDDAAASFDILCEVFAELEAVASALLKLNEADQFALRGPAMRLRELATVGSVAISKGIGNESECGWAALLGRLNGEVPHVC